MIYQDFGNFNIFNRCSLIQRLPEKIRDKDERLKAEMMGKS